MERIFLEEPKVFCVEAWGNDATGDGTPSKPWKSPLGCYNALRRGFDLGGLVDHKVKLGDGVYEVSNQLGSPLTGQGARLLFEGNLSSPDSVLIKPSGFGEGTGYCFSVIDNAAIVLKGMKLDQSNASNDCISIGAAGAVQIEEGVVFGPQLHQFNHVTVANGGNFVVNKPYIINPGLFYKTVSCPALSWRLTPSTLTGIKPFCGVNGPYMPLGCYVSDVDPVTGTVGLSKPTTNLVPLVGSGCNFSYGGQYHVLAGNGAQVYYNTNGDPAAAMDITLVSCPFFYYGMFGALDGATINAQALNFINNAGGQPFKLSSYGVFNTGNEGVPYASGAEYVEIVTSVSAGTLSLTLADTSQIRIGQAVNGVMRKSGGWTAGQVALTLAGGVAGIEPGHACMGDGIRAGTKVLSTDVGTSRIWISYPTQVGGGNIMIKGPGVPCGTTVVDVAGAVVILSKRTTQAVSGLTLRFEGLVDNARYC